MLPSMPSRRPFYAEPSFRYLVMAAVLGLGAVGVSFEIKSGFQKKEQQRMRQENSSGRPAYVPAPEGAATDVAFDGILARVKDYTEPDDRGEPYGRLLRYLGTVDPAALAKTSVYVDYPLFAQHASDLRGKPVRVTALMVASDPLRIERDGFGVEFIHRTYISDMTGDEGYVLDLLEPPAKEIGRRSVVQIDALFLKMASYVGSKDQVVKVPMLLGTKLKLIRERVESDPWNMGTIVVAIAALSIMAVIYFSIRLSSRPRPPQIRRTAIPS